MTRQIFLKTFLLPACLCACLPIPGWAGGFSISGQTNAPDNTNPSARAMALGSAFVGVADDASALFANPAGLAWLRKGEISANTNLWLVGTFQESLLLGLPLSPSWGGIGIATSYLDFGTFEGRDASGSIAPNYGANLLYLKGGWGAEVVRDLALGAGVQGLQSRLADNSYWDLDFDAGALYRPLPGLRLGADFDGLGVNPDSGLSGGVFHLGASYEKSLSPRDKLLASAETSLGPGTIDYIQTGLEYGFNRLLFIRAGWEIPLGDNGIGGLTGLTAGVGFALSDFKLDYAYLPYGDLGSAHRVSLVYAFGASIGERAAASKRLPTGNAASSPYSPRAVQTLPAPAVNALPLPVTGGISGPDGPAPATGQGVPNPSTAGASPVAGPGAQGSVVPRPADSNAAGAKNPLDVDFDFTSDAVAQGQQMEKQGRYREAALLYQQAIQQSPQDVSAWRALGTVYYRFQQKDNAVRCFERVLKLAPDDTKLADWLEKYKALNP